MTSSKILDTIREMHSSFGNDGTDATYKGLFLAYTPGEDDQQKYRVSIRRNIYDHQSYARTDVLHSSGWLPLIDLHYSEISELATPGRNPKVNDTNREQQMLRLAKLMVADAHNAYTAYIA
jgi:hypothetical protein